MIGSAGYMAAPHERAERICNVQDEIWRFVRLNFRTQKEAAAAMGISSAFLSAVMHGKKKPTKAILDVVGIEERTVTTYMRRASHGAGSQDAAMAAQGKDGAA